MHAILPRLRASFNLAAAKENLRDTRGYTMCVAHRDPGVGEAPWLNLPKQGERAPWKLFQNYARDLMLLRYGRLEDGTLQFSAPDRGPQTITAEPLRAAA